MDLKNAKALVTGGSSGIGLATARVLKEREASVVICGRNRERLERAARSVGVKSIQADVAVEKDVIDLVQRVTQELGGYDVLINNAGFGTFASLLDTSLAEMQRVYATNVFGAMLVARESARFFVEQQHGNIVNVASTAGSRGFAGGTVYSSSKFALSGLTECWRAELRKSNIRVMQINPSEVLTEFYSTSGRGEQSQSERKLRGVDIANAIASMLELDDRGFVTEMSVWATNPD